MYLYVLLYIYVKYVLILFYSQLERSNVVQPRLPREIKTHTQYCKIKYAATARYCIISDTDKNKMLFTAIKPA